MGVVSASGVDGLVIGIEANLCRPGCLGEGGFVAVFSLSDPAVLPGTAVLDGPSLEICAREALWSDAVASLGVPGVLPSFLFMAESFRMDKAEGARVWPWAEEICVMGVDDSAPGAGEGVAELLAAA